MQTLFEDDFYLILRDTELNLLIMKDKPANVAMQPQDYRRNRSVMFDILAEYRLPALYDQTEGQFTITPELQEWSIGRIRETTAKTGPRKVALLMGKDLFAKVSVEQTLEDTRRAGIFDQFRYFDDRQAAIDWLLED